MASANDLIMIARQRLGIQSSEEPLQAHEAVDGYNSLKDMLSGWVLEEAIKAFTTVNPTSPVTLTLADDMVLSTDLTAEALAANLALRVSSYYGIDVPRLVVADAVMGKNAIQAKNLKAIETTIEYSPGERSITSMPSQRYLYT